MKNTKNKKGFTLVEIIIAIAALAIICGFILQIFILASTVNQRAVDKQNAIIGASNIVEVLNSIDYINEIYSDEYFGEIDYSLQLIEDGTDNEKISFTSEFEGLTLETVITTVDYKGYVEINVYKDEVLVLDEQVIAYIVFKGNHD